MGLLGCLCSARTGLVDPCGFLLAQDVILPRCLKKAALWQSPCSGKSVIFFFLGKSQALGKGVCGEELPHGDVELWEGVSFPELVLDRMRLYKQGKIKGRNSWREKEVQSASAGPSATAKVGEALWRCREILHILALCLCS